MGTVEYAQRLLNEKRLPLAALPDILSGQQEEAALRRSLPEAGPDAHAVRTAVTLAMKGRGEEEMLTPYADYAELFLASLEKFTQVRALILPEAADPAALPVEGTRTFVQNLSGGIDLVAGLLAASAVCQKLAGLYSGGLEMTDDDMVGDALKEFLNVQNGLYGIQYANRGQDVDLGLPREARDARPTGKQLLVLRAESTVGTFYLLLAQTMLL